MTNPIGSAPISNNDQIHQPITDVTSSLINPAKTSGLPFLNTPENSNLPVSSATTNLKKEYDRINDNIFSKELTPGSDAQKIRDTLKHGGYLSCAFSGGIATAISFKVSAVAAKVLGLGVAGPTIATCAACGAIGGAGFGAWLAVKFAKELSDKHPGVAGMTLAVGWTVLGAPLAVGVFSLAGAAKGFGLGMTGSFCMAQAVGFGAFKLSLIVLEPLAQKLIADPRIEKVKTMLAGIDLANSSENQNSTETIDEQNTTPFSNDELKKLALLEFSKEDIENLTKFCKEPLGHSMNYWYDNIFSPPLHEDLKRYANYVDWKADKKKDLSEVSQSIAAEKPKDHGWDGFAAVIKDIGSGIKGLLTNPSKIKSKTLETVEHAQKTALHRITFQIFRQNTGKTYANGEHPLEKVAKLAEKGNFINANQAWENFHQMERRHGRSKQEKDLVEKVKATIRANYGPEPTLTETLTCGWYTSERLRAIDAITASGNESTRVDAAQENI